jgi:integrative and conjugative element protein (TIGR02256 family)
MKIFLLKKFKILITDNVLEIFNKHKQLNQYDNESGGIVLGQISGETIYINRVSPPNKLDKASRYGFVRNKNAAQIVVNYEFLNSDRQIIYLGEWHTHPEITPKPSSQDKKMIKEQYKYNVLNEPFLFLIIQGTEDLYVACYDGNNLIECVESSQA